MLQLTCLLETKWFFWRGHIRDIHVVATPLWKYCIGIRKRGCGRERKVVKCYLGHAGYCLRILTRHSPKRDAMETLEDLLRVGRTLGTCTTPLRCLEWVFYLMTSNRKESLKPSSCLYMHDNEILASLISYSCLLVYQLIILRHINSNRHSINILHPLKINPFL